MVQIQDPKIELHTSLEETTLYIDGVQAMQAWEKDLMEESADLLCQYGDTFLEVGLGLGLSGRRIASNPRTKSHTIVEKYQRVIDLFHQANSDVLPASLRIVHADILEYARTLELESYDGIFFDPELPSELNDSPEAMEELLGNLTRSLRPGGVLIPFFTVQPTIKEKYLRHFDRALLLQRSFEAYSTTNYTDGVLKGKAYIQCFFKE